MRKDDQELVNLEQELSRLGMAGLNAPTLGKAKRGQEGQESIQRLREAKNSQVNTKDNISNDLSLTSIRKIIFDDRKK